MSTTNKNPGVAAVLSFIIPGLGQIYCERILRGLVFLGLAIFGYMLFVFPGVIVAIVSMLDARALAQGHRKGIFNDEDILAKKK